MLKKSLIISLGAVVAFVFIAVILVSISKTLNFAPNREELTEELGFEETGFSNEEEPFGGEFIFEDYFESEDPIQESFKNITVEEELAIAEKLASFMSLNRVKELSTEEWILLEKKLAEINLEELKKMTMVNFIEILEDVKK